MATSSSSPRHRQPRLVDGQPLRPPPMEGTEGTQEEEETSRKWAELPLDALLAVLHRLDHADVLMGAGQVCRPWRCAARDEPELWRRVDMRPRAELASRVDLKDVARTAVRCSAGRCEAFWAEGVGDDEFLFFLADAAPMLKSLRLISCNNISTYRIDEAISKFPLLEELELSLYTSIAAGLYDLGDACPLLTRLRLSRDRFRRRRGVDDSEAKDIARMRGLCSLQLFGNSLGNAGLATILDGCRRLESLDIRHCFNVLMDDEMRSRCARVKTLRLPDDSMEDYDLRFDSPDMDSGSMLEYSFRGDILWDSW
ncbi:putative F-box/LRR-repeat protein 23 [Phragmites australis]|uniref:putative F-box/LRR-repeat protein 23 n=1 Tax=Phragmites australis TaxID=29695 RepID=UPI002D765A77|nr:putative F-box/LRR-repeat protein 23 [Phragmites australis]